MLQVEGQYMIRRLKEDGLSISAISRRTGHCRDTIRKYLYDQEFKTYKPRPIKDKILDPYKKYIISRLDRYEDLSAVVLYEEIQEMGYEGSYSTVKKFMRPIKKSKRIEAECRYETKPGVQGQVDWGELGTIEVDGDIRKLYCFAMILGFSRMRYMEVTLDTTTETFIQCHMNGFQFYGGYPREFLYDNTKNVVIKRALMSSKSEFNPQFQDFFRYYGFMPRLCKPGIDGAKTKGKVESLVKYIKGNFYYGKEFADLSDMENRSIHWLDKVNRKDHGTTKRPPIELLKEEKLMPFDKKSPFQIVRTEYRKISNDCYFSYLGNLYSVPWKYAGCQAKLRIQNRNMMVFVNDQNICEHTKREGNGRIIRMNEHFDGLQKAIKDRNRTNHEKRIQSLKIVAPEVERRPLVEYDIFTGGDLNEQ
ncbi:MAG: IS21 family transposase [Candidatus Thorarchaeota archaeon]|nr:IS21 family transposase [Euryarchaeota archaeon]